MNAPSGIKAFCTSGGVVSTPLLLWTLAFGLFSGSLPLETTGEDGLLIEFVGVGASEFTLDLVANAVPGLVLPTEVGLSGSFVRRFGGASSGKSAGTIGCTGVLDLGPGELGLEAGPGVRTPGGPRPTEEDRDITGVEGVVARRVGVEGREFARDNVGVEFEFTPREGRGRAAAELELELGLLAVEEI